MMLEQFGLMLVAAVATALAQWMMVRKLHAKHVAQLKGRHEQVEQATTRLLEQSRRQVAQLQKDLAAARLDATRVSRGREHADAREALRKSLHDAPPSNPMSPPEGFAETLPSLQFPPDSLLGVH